MKNMNEMAVVVSQLDSGFEELDIAQIKRVLKCIAKLLVEDKEALLILLKNGRKQIKG